MANVHEMLNDVHQHFSFLGEKYPRIKSNLDKCYENIKAIYSLEEVIPKEKEKEDMKKLSTKLKNMKLEEVIPNEKKKEDIKKLLTKSIDMKHLEISYDGLINETAGNEEDLIKLLENLSQAMSSYRKKTTLFAARRGKLLKNILDAADIQTCSKGLWIFTSLLQFFNLIE